MSKYNYTKGEKEILAVIKDHDDRLQSIHTPDTSVVDAAISDSEELLRSIGYQPSAHFVPSTPTIARERKTIHIPSWEEMVAEATAKHGDVVIEDLFTPEELASNEKAIILLNQEFNQLYKLDKFDIAISAAAGLIAAAVDILLVGIPHKTPDGLKAGKLSDYIRAKFDEKFPAEEMEKLANSKKSKVPFDAQDNRHTTVRVEGMSAYYHRLLSLGHDPLLGLVIGVADIMTGKMTTIDKAGNVVSQVMENYANRQETNLFKAIAKQIIHFKSDITTSMGLPVPLMGLFNLLQFGSIGEEEQTIAEIVQGMYYEGYDFIHFASMSIPTMIVEVVVRLGYAIKRIKEGHSIKESLPFSLNRDKNPKLSTMLFIAHSAATAINAGKVAFTKNPMAINYPQWLAFAKYSYTQLKWVLIDKPEKRDAYISGKLNENLMSIYDDAEQLLDSISNDYNIVFD